MKARRLLLLLCLTLMAGSAAWAEEYIKVSNREMPFTESWTKSSSYFNDASGSGSVSWDAAKRKLTLNNFNVWRGGELNLVNVKTCIEVYSTKSVTIEVVGFNKIVNYKGQTLALHGNTTFTGNGTLKLGNNDDKKPGIDLLEENLDITVNGPTLKFECKNGGIRGKNNTGTLHVKAGEVMSSSEGKLVTGLANVTWDYGMGVKSPHGAWFSHEFHCMLDVNGNVITNQAVELDTLKYYGFRICGREINEGNYDIISTWGDVTEGRVFYSPSTNRLVLDKATINSQTSSPTIENHDNDGLIVQLIGENTFKFDGVNLKRDAFRLMKNTTIMSFEPGAELNALRSGVNYVYEHAGIYVASGKKLTLQNVTLQVAHLAGGNAYTFLNMADDAYIYFLGGKDKGTVRNINVINKSKCPEVAVSSGNYAGFIWNSASVPGIYMNKKELLTVGTSLSTRSDVEWYPLSICGHRINSKNHNYIVNEYLESGYISYNPYNGTLLMSGVNINYDDQWRTDPVIKFNWTSADANNDVKPDLYISLGSNNTIKTGNAEAFSCSGDLHFSKPINVTEEKRLTITGKNAKIYSSKGLTIERVTVSASELEANTLTVKDAKLNVTKKLDINKYVGENEVVASTPEAPAYYDSKKQKVVASKGLVNFVPSSSVEVYDDIKFCGQEINSANHSCVMNEYVKVGSLSINKENDRYDINLEGVGVSYDSSIPVFEFTSSTSMNFNIKGINIFNVLNAGNDALFIKSSNGIVKFNGRSEQTKLWVCGSKTTNAGAIFLATGGSLRLNNYAGQNSEFNVAVPRIFGSGATSSLGVYAPYLYVSSHQQGTVKDVSVSVGSDVELYNTSSTPREIRSDGIYSNGKLCTNDVKFVAKGESYIPVRRIEVTPSKLTLTKKGETQTLSATVLPSNATNKKVVWESSNESVATVDQNGKVRAVGRGWARIQAISSDEYEEEEEGTAPLSLLPHIYCDVTVDIPEPTSIALDQTEVLIDQASKGGVYLTATLTPDNAETEYTWESSDENIVSVNPNSGQMALVRRVADEGEATITVKTSNGLQATCKITIHYPITPMLVNFEQRTYTLTEVGQQIKLEPIVTPDNCEKLSFSWYTSSDAISLSDDGTVTARRNGSAVVECWACYDGQKYAPGEVRINVEIPPTPVIATGLKLKASDTFFYALGETALLTPIFTPENVTNKELTWNSENPDVTTVDEDGFVTIVGWGDCRITATTKDGSNIKAGYTVTAIDPSTIPDPVYATGIKLDMNEITLMRGEEARIGVTIDPANYNGDIMPEAMEGDISIAQVNTEWDWNTNRINIYIRSEEWSEMYGDMKFRIRPTQVDWEKLNAMGITEEPADTLTIHVLAPIIFAEASPEDINITYHVTDINDKTCEVYTQPRPGMTMIDPLDTELIPAVSQTATGMLTVPAKANGYWVTNVMPCAFNRCSGLTEIDFSEGIETIGDYACYSGLFSLQRVTLPSTIKELGQYCFSANSSDYATSEDPSGRNHIREVNIKAFTPPTGLNGSDINWSGAFHQVASDAVLYVPAGALAAYNVEPWTGWFSRIAEKQFFEDPDGIEEIHNSKFKIQNEGAWFDLSGRKLGKKPAKPGLYIRNGKKVLVK